jgi:hypothetical protein
MGSTGPIQSWQINPAEVGPIYPFAGWEILMLVACLAFGVMFMVWKFNSESANYAQKSRQLRESGELAKILKTEGTSETG